MMLRNNVEMVKPDIRQLVADGFTIADMHLHTKYSKDSFTSIEALAKRLRKTRLGVAVTDHNAIAGAIRLSEQKGIFCIPGIELTSREGIHLLAYFHTLDELARFYEKHVEPFKKSMDFEPLAELLANSGDYDCIRSMPHPYGATGVGLFSFPHERRINKDILRRYECIEVLNGSSLQKNNLRALKLACDLNKSMTSGSDAHTLRELGIAITYTKEADSVDAFLKKIIKKRIFIVGKEVSKPRLLISQFSKLKPPLTNPIGFIRKTVRLAREIKNRKVKCKN